MGKRYEFFMPLGKNSQRTNTKPTFFDIHLETIYLMFLSVSKHSGYIHKLEYSGKNIVSSAASVFQVLRVLHNFNRKSAG